MQPLKQHDHEVSATKFQPLTDVTCACGRRYMPAKEGPYHIRGATEMQDIPPHEQSGEWGEPMLPIGLVREFQVSRKLDA